VLEQGLCDDKPVERVTVVKRQDRDLPDVSDI
jgi:hypothetical protein